MSQDELAAAASLTRDTISKLERDLRGPLFTTLLALARGLDVTPSALVEAVDDDTEDPAEITDHADAERDRRAAPVSFGRRIRELRLERGMTQEDLARTAGLYRSEISRCERGTKNPRRTTTLQLARGLDVKPGDLVEGLRGDAETRRDGPAGHGPGRAEVP
jgi:transcriptional regulator with XRE-family HTH domain